MRSDIATMLNHLWKCTNQPQNVRSWADTEHQTKYSHSSTQSLAFTPLFIPSPAPSHDFPSHQLTQSTLALSLQQFSLGQFHSQPGFTPQLLPLDISNQSPGLVVNTPLPLPQQPYVNALGFSPQASPNILPIPPPSRPSSSLSLYPQSFHISASILVSTWSWSAQL